MVISLDKGDKRWVNSRLAQTAVDFLIGACSWVGPLSADDVRHVHE